MTTAELISIPLSILALGIFFDIVLNSGEGMASIFGSIRGKQAKIGEITIEDTKTEFAKQLLEELDDLRDDLTYENTPEDREAILNKIKDREKILEKII